MTRKEMCADLGISISAVRGHFEAVFRKLHCRSVAEAVAIVLGGFKNPNKSFELPGPARPQSSARSSVSAAIRFKA